MATDGLLLHLPYPPSVNRYWRKWRNRIVISTQGRAYREAVCDLLAPHRAHHKPLDGRLALRLDLFPPDRRKRDCDNALKCTNDSLEHAGVFENDNQIDLLVVARKEVIRGGEAHVLVESLPLTRCLLCGQPIKDETNR